MRRARGVALLLLVILVGVSIGVGAYHAGVNHGLTQAREGGQIIRVVGPGYGFGFFPFGLFLFPVFFFLIFGLFRAAFWGRRWGGPGPGREGWESGHWSKGGRGAMFEDWHRRQHQQEPEQSGQSPGPGGEPASV